MAAVEENNVRATLDERGKRYGSFREHAKIAQALKWRMEQTPGWARMTPDKREALEMIQHKIARILNGDQEYQDSWHDIAGYAQLIVDILKQENTLGKDRAGNVAR